MEIQLWRELLDPYQLAVDELTVKFHHIIEEHRNQGLYSPIESVDGRVKSIVSILDKMQRKNVSMNDIEKKIEDLAGIRIICQFEEDIETVASLIQNRSDMTIKSEKNYLKHVKQSGYRSLHLIIYYTVETLNGPRKLQAEIQIRTMAMDFWATIEHSLQYKYKGDMPPHVAERLTNAADAIILLDQEMSSVRDEIMDAQNSSQMQSNFVKDILIRYKNLKRIYGYKIDSYWSNIASVESYYKTNMDFLKKEVRDYFFREYPDVHSKVDDNPPAKYNPGCQVKNSLIANGSIINGYVENSVIFKKVFVGENCVIKNSIVLNDVYLGDNVYLENCIVESRDTIRANTRYVGEKDIKLVIESNERYVL